MEIQKIFSDTEGQERLYSVLMTEEELSFFSNLEDYEELDSKKLSKLTDNQLKMILEDERSKAKRNAKKIIEEFEKREAKIGAEEGRKSGKRTGRKVGGILGGGVGLTAALANILPKGSAGASYSNLAKVLIASGALTAGTGVGEGLGYLIGGSAGEKSGREEGKKRGNNLGKRKVKDDGHDEIDRAIKIARKIDEYKRKHKKDDHWETDLRELLKREDSERRAEAARKRAEEIARRRVEAEERKADAEMKRATTDRARYWEDRYDRYYRN